MSDSIAAGYLAATTAWASDAGKGPRLRGRRRDARGPLIHFLHGNGFCGGVYWPLLKRLLPDYGLFCHDIEGHGASDAPTRYSGTSAIIERVPQILDDQCAGIGPVIGMGHSFGAAVTLATAARNPGRFRALVLLDPILLPAYQWWGLQALNLLGRNPMANGARRRRARWSSRTEVLEKLRGRGIYRGWQDEGMDCFIDQATRDDADGTRVLCCPPTLEGAIFENPIYPWRVIRQVDCPVLLVYGADSYPFFPATIAAIRRLNPSIDIRRVAGGHCFMQEDPDATARLVLDFLQRQDL